MDISQIISLIFGSSLLTGIFGHYIKWGIEKKKLKRQYRQDLIKEVRDYIVSDEFGEQSIRNSKAYGRIREHLTQELDNEIRQKKNGVTVVVGGGGYITGKTFLKESIEIELSRLEKKWELI
jgi:hypothetical protein